MSTFSERLRDAMRAKGYNMNSLANELGHKSGSRVHAWLNGTLPDGKNMQKLIDALEVDGHWILMGPENGKRERPPSEKEWAFDQISELVSSVGEGKPTATPADASARELAHRAGESAVRQVEEREAAEREAAGQEPRRHVK